MAGGEPDPKRARHDAASDDDSSGSPSASEASEGGVDALAALTLHFLDPGAESEGTVASTAHPLYTHQIFEDDRIEGHEGLRIDLTLSQTSYHAHLAVWGVQPKEPGAIDVQATLVEALPGVFTDRAAFQAALAATGPPPVSDLGPIISSFPFGKGGGDGATVHIHATMLAAASSAVKSLHARVQNLFTFFIDGASDIDQADPAWELLTAVVVASDPPGGGPKKPTIVAGMATLNHMWGYPDVTRLRVCQVLALPPAQGKGVGEGLVRAAYALADARQDPASSSSRPVLDVTYEDPTDEMQVLREKVEAERAAGCAWLAAAADAAAAGVSGGGNENAAAAAKTGTGKGKARAGEDDGAPPPPVPSPLTLAPSDIARARRELHLTRAATAGAWEALLAARLGTDSPALAAAVRARLASAAGGAVAATAGPGPKGGPKRIFDAPDEATGFVMCRVPPGAAAAAAQAAAAAGPAAAALAAVAATGAGPELEAGVAEKEAAALYAATQARLSVLEAVAGRLHRIKKGK